MAALLYGPDGKPLVTSASTDLVVAKQEVEKRVRNQATSLTSVWDPRRGKPKPTPVTFETLRMMANRNEIVRAIIKTRKNQIGRTKWSIVPKDEDDNTASTKRLCDQLTQLLRRPSMKGSRPHSRSWRQFIGEVLEDILVLDAGCIEKERNSFGWIVAMYPVDGATIRPNLDDRGGAPDDAYVQLVDGQVTARFGMEDLVYIMDNPLTDIRFAGYGYSPLEHLIVSVTAELFSSKYNADYFQKGSVPEGLLNLGEEVPPEDVDAFRLYWMNEIMGKPWAIPIVAGKGVTWQQWRQSNRDMEYMAYQQWLLKKICAGYQIPPQEIGELEDVNRSTADSQQETNATKSVEPILTLLADYIEVEIIGEHGQGVGDYVEFRWDEEQEDEERINRKFALMVENGAATRNEWREAVNMDPIDEDGADELLVSGQLQGLPSSQDLEALSASAKQEQEAQQFEQQLNATALARPAAGAPGGQGVQPKRANPTAGINSQTTRVSAGVGKVSQDRNPALTEREDDLVAVFDEAQDQLITGIARILDVPLAKQ